MILGGSSKNSDFSLLAKKISQEKSIKALILIGQEAGRIEDAIVSAGGHKGRILKGAENMQQIVNMAKNIASDDDIVILSPACASFGMFKNYQDRGEQFIKEIKQLK